MDFGSIFHQFLGAQNYVLYCKTNSFERFRLSRKSMKNHRFWHPFWHHFGSFWHHVSILFRHRFLDAFWEATFSIFDAKMLDLGTQLGRSWAKMGPKIAQVVPKGGSTRLYAPPPGGSKNQPFSRIAFKTLPGTILIDFEWIFN